jgi:hypothetical protein
MKTKTPKRRPRRVRRLRSFVALMECARHRQEARKRAALQKMGSPSSTIHDTFRGDNKLLRESIKALIELDNANALVPHGIGGHARTLLAACYLRLPNNKLTEPHHK